MLFRSDAPAPSERAGLVVFPQPDHSVPLSLRRGGPTKVEETLFLLRGHSPNDESRMEQGPIALAANASELQAFRSRLAQIESAPGMNGQGSPVCKPLAAFASGEQDHGCGERPPACWWRKTVFRTQLLDSDPFACYG